MCVYNFVNVLEFFLYYVFIDKIWVDWQVKSNDYMEIYFIIVFRYV